MPSAGGNGVPVSGEVGVIGIIGARQIGGTGCFPALGVPA